MNIIDHLTTPGTFVFTPKGEYACVRAFNATTNEVEVTVAVGLTRGFKAAMSCGIRERYSEQFEADMRAKGVWRSYHFKNLRVAPDQEG